MEKHYEVANCGSFRVYFEAHDGRIFSKLINGVKTAMSKVIELVLGKLIWSGRVLIVSEAEMRSFVQTETVARTIVKSVLHSKRFIVPIAGIVG